MTLPDNGGAQDHKRSREQLLSQGHNPPRFVDRVLPTWPVTISADGGPSKTDKQSQGTNPWIVGSLTIGSNHVLVIDEFAFDVSTPNVWFKLRHNHASNRVGSAPPGGTLRSWHLAARGHLSSDGPMDKGILRVRGPGTVFLYGFGAGSVSGTSSNRVHRALGTRGVDRVSARVGGWIV